MRITPSSIVALVVVVAPAVSVSAQTSPSPGSPCGPALVAPLWAAVPEAERAGFSVEPPADEDPRGTTAPRVTELELDGVAPREAVLGVDAIGDGSSAHDGHSAVWVLACRGTSWTSIGRLLFDNDWSWSGTLDDVPGLRVLRAETVAGLGHDLLRVEHVDVRGGADPRYVRRRFVLAHVIDGALVTALDLVVSEVTEAGPRRDEVFRATRTLVLRRGTLPSYHLTVRTVEERRRARVCRTVLELDGRSFVPADAACAAR